MTVERESEGRATEREREEDNTTIKTTNATEKQSEERTTNK